MCCVATGIKNLQKEAVKHDIAVYFEANGHGTVYFSPRFYDIIRWFFHYQFVVTSASISLPTYFGSVSSKVPSILKPFGRIGVLNM